MTKQEHIDTTLRVGIDEHERCLMRTGADQPSFKELVAYMERHGTDGILESAYHLSDEQFAALAVLVKKHATPRRRRATRRRRSR